MTWKKLGRALLFPPAALAAVLIPVSAAALAYGLSALEEHAPVRIASYLLAFYALIVLCARLWALPRKLKAFKSENRFARRWFSDVRLRVNVTLCFGALWNGAYGVLQLALGIYHKSAWFCALFGYYFCLALMRFYLARYTLRHRPAEKMREEWRRCRTCGWVFLVLNIALSVMIFYMVARNRAVRHHEITTIAMAAYTFTSLTMAAVNMRKYRKLGSPAVSASKAISLTSACVSMLTLEATMLTTFGGANMSEQSRQLFLGLSGAAICALILVMAICLIVRGSKEIKKMENEYGKE